MTIFNGVVLYVLLWWVLLFAVLPFGTRPTDVAPEAGGWRGAPEQPRLGRKALITTALAALAWLVCYAVITSGWISFRSGWFALPPS